MGHLKTKEPFAFAGLWDGWRKPDGKRVELFKEAVTKIARVAVLHESASPASARELKEVQAAARALGLTQMDSV